MVDRHPTFSRADTESSSIPQIEIMSPARKTSTKREPRDTGFPEPFHNGPNTTLPHPDADLSPNATLSYEDVSAERMMKRHRLSFLKKNKRAVSHGVIDPQSEALHSMLSLSMFSTDMGDKHSQQFINMSTTSLRLSKDGGDSVHSSSKKDEDTPPTSPDVSEHRRKSGIFNRWKRN
ncbi:hypothetical protein QQS21_007913 [Conoideocrella luteorostrata]|uniref:Uncharacterized protein n=1 Tax=Conoideocrella luteorostrata TaxID=1105319 RepID=A0AAJ0CKR3_9HYPO|nr:hypothetical protein QQS21_007913 [Conoideocrella luteorostrata]